MHINRELVAARVRDELARASHPRRGDLREGDELARRGTGAFLHVPLAHFLATPEGRAAGEAWSQRLGG